MKHNSIFTDLDKIFSKFDDIFGDENLFNLKPNFKTSIQKITRTETSNDVTLKFEVPGLGKEDLQLKVENSLLLISEKKENGKTLYSYDLELKSFESIDATCDKGILTIKIQKHPNILREIKIN